MTLALACSFHKKRTSHLIFASLVQVEGKALRSRRIAARSRRSTLMSRLKSFLIPASSLPSISALLREADLKTTLPLLM